eukprot:TRINITY_DN1146_c0_g1_i1.p1 TRINITY_DN1146_c0_g1~~TRINITY_DN1146_c0_g1_i1.p1  ORF type:complete len:114 (+),score=16.68 TRINITY_DN1146_c0_g1_i1:128-469(+)
MFLEVQHVYLHIGLVQHQEKITLFLKLFLNIWKPTYHKRDCTTLYFDYGNKTLDAHYPQYAQRVDGILKAKGYTELDAKNLFFEGTDHSENSWNKRLDQPLEFLLGTLTKKTK